MKNQTLLNGLYAGVLFFFWKMTVLALGKQHDWLPTFPGLTLLLLVGIFVFISITRYTEKGSTLPDDFKAGARTALVAAITGGFFVFAYYSWFDPEFMPVRIQINMDAARALGEIPEQDLQKAEEQMRQFYSPFAYSTLTVSGTAFFGMAFALIVAGLKRAFRVL